MGQCVSELRNGGDVAADSGSAIGDVMDRKLKRDAKNARHRRNERRREVLRILRMAPALTRLLGAAEDIARQIRGW